MGNLSPEEILKRIEGDSKGKTKGNQKSGTNASKEQSSAAANASKGSSGRKKADKKERQAEKATKRSGTSEAEVVALSTKMETLRIEKEKAAVAETAPVSNRAVSRTTTDASSKVETEAVSSKQVEEMGGSEQTAKNAAERSIPTEEGIDDEEQYMSADEGVNSNVSDDVYHTDEQSGASGSRDFISDGANYRADNEEVIPLPVTSEEAEFIPVTARSKKRTGGAGAAQQQHQQLPGTDRRYVSSNSAMDRDSKSSAKHTETDRPRRGSVQLPQDTPANLPPRHGNGSPSPVDRKSPNIQQVKGEVSQRKREGAYSVSKKHGIQKYSGPVRRLPLLADFIGDTSMLKGQGSKSNGKGNSGSAGHQQHQQLKPATSASTVRKTKYGPPSSLQTSRTTSPDRRSSQPSTGKYVAIAGSRQSDLTIYPTGSQGSVAKALLSPTHKTEKKGFFSSSDKSAKDSSFAERKVSGKHTAGGGAAAGGKIVVTEASSSSSSTTASSTTAGIANAPGVRSWADIAKKRLLEDGESRTNEVSHRISPRNVSPELQLHSKGERPVSATCSISGRIEGSNKLGHRAVSVDAGGSDSGVKDYSFFFDPNEPSATPGKGARSEDSTTAKKGLKKADGSNQLPSGRMVLNLEGGRRIVLPEGSTQNTGSTAIVDSRQRLELQILREAWRKFTEAPAPTKYKEVMKQKAAAKKPVATEEDEEKGRAGGRKENLN